MERAPAVEVCVAVVLDRGRVLVRRRPRGGHLPGAWEFPGGKRLPGEGVRACAERETREETGLLVRAGPGERRLVHRYPDRTVRLRFLPCALVGGRPCSRGAALRWVAPAALLDLPTPEANAPVIADLVRGAWPTSAAPAGGRATAPPRPRRGASASAPRARGTPARRRRATSP